ncbi:flavin reductase family protein [Microbacterium terregens]|uniref:Flavin reductase family protein n=1 Tax=Microbacterium terregens TaxID=69363 RepID=A0ABV5SZ10_9MICO
MSSPFEPYPVALVHRLIEPGPTVLITTAGEEWPTVMTNGFNMSVRHDGLLAVIVGRWDSTYESLRRKRECVVAVPGSDLIGTAVDVGNSSSADVNKWERFGLTPRPASVIGAPLIAECVANIECVVEDDSLVDAYGLWVLRAEAAWRYPEHEAPEFHHRGDGTFSENGALHDMRDRMTRWQYLS